MSFCNLGKNEEQNMRIKTAKNNNYSSPEPGQKQDVTMLQEIQDHNTVDLSG